MKFAIEKYYVKGINVLLPKSIEPDWRNIIKFQSVPYYFIINKEGVIVENGKFGESISMSSLIERITLIIN